MTPGVPRTVQQLLCPDCSNSWCYTTSWNQPPDYTLPVEVLA
jgi:hypothetical protein